MIRRLALLAFVFISFSQISNAQFKGKIRAVTMAIDKTFLEQIKNDETLYFTVQYHNRSFKKDQVWLTAYVAGADKKSIVRTRDLDTYGQGEKFFNEMRYSIYQLSKQDIDAILSFYGNATGTVYFLLEPFIYRGDNRYFSYRIAPADESKKKISFDQKSKVQKGGETVLPRETALYLNPSPPASEHLSEEGIEQ